MRNSTSPVGKREIARAFQIKGPDRIALKKVIRELRAEGVLAGPGRKRLFNADEPLPPVAVLSVGDVDEDGDFFAEPENWPHEEAAPTIRLSGSGRFGGQIASGARVLARLHREENGGYEAKAIRVLPTVDRIRMVGVVRQNPGEGFHVVPTDRRQRGYFPLAIGVKHPALSDGDLVQAVEVPTPRESQDRRRGGDRTARVRIEEVLGRADSPDAISLIAIHAAGIPNEFPTAALDEAAQAKPIALGARTDLRDLPLITIDGEDARDFDDAVFAEAAETGGDAAWRLVVAIADVSAYVVEGSALDQEATKRGNSTYFPDRVVPMLPEALSNNLCSLRPGEDRAVLFVDIKLSADGEILAHRFGRGLIRSAARITYEKVQALVDGDPDVEGPAEAIAALYGVFQALQRGREKRGALDLDLTEPHIQLSKDGRVAAVVPRSRLDSHRLIEECMIAANVCAAQALGRRGRPCLYRNHDAPSPEKIAATRDFLAPFGYRLPKTGVVTNKHLTALLDRARGSSEMALVNETVLRAQAQANYGPENIGHFGLGLVDYAHFTSPIRRYADLVVHRSLIRTFGLGDGGLSDEQTGTMGETATHISFTERRSAAAERDATNRYMAAHLADRIGDQADGVIAGVTRFGLFIRLDGSMAEGLIPIAQLGSDYFDFDPARQQLVGRQSGRTFTLGDPLTIRIRDADPLTGSSLFELVATAQTEGDLRRPKHVKSRKRNAVKRHRR